MHKSITMPKRILAFMLTLMMIFTSVFIGEEKVYAEEESQNIEEIQNEEESQNIEEIQNEEESQNIEEIQDTKGFQNSKEVEAIQLLTEGENEIKFENHPVFFEVKQNEAKVKVTNNTYDVTYNVFAYTEKNEDVNTEETKTVYAADLKAGKYSYTVTADGYYGSVCAFTVGEDGSVTYTNDWSSEIRNSYGLDEILNKETNTFHINLEKFKKSDNPDAWNGTTLDVSWFLPEEETYEISTPAQLAGLAAIVNGIYNPEITSIIDLDESGMIKEYTQEEYEVYQNKKIVRGFHSSSDTTGPDGNNLVTSNIYYFSAKGYDFDGKTIYLKKNLDMGGYQENGEWTGARYMPIGGEYPMYYIKNGLSDGHSHTNSSFNGKLDGMGHIVYNIYCDRYTESNYGDSVAIGLIGRLGNHEKDYDTWQEYGDNGGNYPAKNPTVRNMAVAGYIRGRRSVGGIVGKIGKTSATIFGDKTIGGTVENCINFAEIENTDAKGVGGIAGAAWNNGIIRNCANFGNISSKYQCPTGGIAGSNEISLKNCYNIGNISSGLDSFAVAIGSHNDGVYTITNCYWLTDTAPGGGYYGNAYDKKEVIEIKERTYMQSEEFLEKICGTGRDWEFAAEGDAIYEYAGAFPVPRCFLSNNELDVCERIDLNIDEELLRTKYVEGETVDTTGLKFEAFWSDGTSEIVEELEVEPNRELNCEDSKVTVTANVGAETKTYEYNIKVSEMQVKEISVETEANSNYSEDDLFDPSGMKVKITYTNEKSVVLIFENGQFLNINDKTESYNDVKLTPESGMVLDEKWNGKSVVVSYTYKGKLVTAETKKLTVISKQNRPTIVEDVYQIENAKQLDWVAQQVNSGQIKDIKVKLVNDIITSSEFEPIGNSTNMFNGSFDGDGHKVVLDINTESQYIGILGCVDNAEIKNVIAAGTVVTTKDRAAGVVGYAKNAVIENCGNEADITGKSMIGGIAGHINSDLQVSITGCYNTGTITAQNNAGGIVATTKNCNITNCYNWGMVSGKGNSTYPIGGIVGKINSDSMQISNVYNAGKINALSEDAEYVGAISGYNYGTFSNYYWLGDNGTECAVGIRLNNPSIKENKCTSSELKKKIIELGEVYKVNVDAEMKSECFPVLNWQEICGHHIENNICKRCGLKMGEQDVLLGDVNKDGVINLKDILLLQQYIAKLSVQINQEAADVTKDGVLNLKDVIIMQQYVAKIIKNF